MKATPEERHAFDAGYRAGLAKGRMEGIIACGAGICIGAPIAIVVGYFLSRLLI